ncbi:MAG: hypothetical protein P8Y99_13690 [Calditrichaceae bacterium]|jgi:hypothetical protein
MVYKYFFAWFGMMVLAILNGGVRDFIYTEHVGELVAHQISTVILIFLIAIYLWFLTRFWPIKSAKLAWIIGFMWFIMTELFEFGMGRFLLNKSWDTLFQTYNLFTGQLWILIPFWVLLVPYIIYRFVQRNISAS